MSDKKFKIKPKVWPKEYTFEEFKQLNPNISENLLINYYNKYLQEYAETRSRHINHFNDTKDNLSKELNLLNEKLINNITDNPDRDLTVGPTGAGRFYHKALPADVHSVYFSGSATTNNMNCVHVDESFSSSYYGAGSPLRPLDQFTLAVWYKNLHGYSDTGSPVYMIYDNYSGGGFYMHMYHTRVEIRSVVDKGNGTYTIMSASMPHTQCLGEYYISGTDTNLTESADYPRAYGHPAKNGWHLLVGTFNNKDGVKGTDGNYTSSLKLYIDGEKANKYGTLASPSTDSSTYWMKLPGSTGLNVSGAAGTIYYDGQEVGDTQPGRYKFSPMIGKSSNIDSVTGIIKAVQTGTAYTSSIAEVAFWNKALDEDTIKDLYNGVVSSSKGARYDLAYEGHSTKIYDVVDEGLDYTNVGKYAKNLQLWYQFEEPMSSSRAIDYSGKGHHGIYKNLPYISGSSYKTYPNN